VPQKFQRRPQRYPLSPGHQKEWIQACKAHKPAGSDFSYGGPLTEVALLGVIAMRFKGRKLEWDAAAMKFTNCPEANAFLKPSFARVGACKRSPGHSRRHHRHHPAATNVLPRSGIGLLLR